MKVFEVIGKGGYLGGERVLLVVGANSRKEAIKLVAKSRRVPELTIHSVRKVRESKKPMVFVTYSG